MRSRSLTCSCSSMSDIAGASPLAGATGATATASFAATLAASLASVLSLRVCAGEIFVLGLFFAAASFSSFARSALACARCFATSRCDISSISVWNVRKLVMGGYGGGMSCVCGIAVEPSYKSLGRESKPVMLRRNWNVGMSLDWQL